LPLLFAFKKVRSNLYSLFFISLLVNLGMWSERLWIVISATWHDFLPHNWGSYFPSWVELTILGGSFCFFFFWFLSFSRTLPVVSLSDVKTESANDAVKKHDFKSADVEHSRMENGIVAVFTNPNNFVSAIEKVRDLAMDGLETFTPMKLEAAEKLMGRTTSPVWIWTLGGAISGCVGGFALAIYAASLNGLMVGGKPPVSIIPFCIVGFEALILFGSIGNLIGLVLYAKLGPKYSRKPIPYKKDFSNDRLGLFAACSLERMPALRKALETTEPEEIYEVGP
jgi:hypothetical protein